jgi:hypothetical protein
MSYKKTETMVHGEWEAGLPHGTARVTDSQGHTVSKMFEHGKEIEAPKDDEW